jgi:putative membrane protein
VTTWWVPAVVGVALLGTYAVGLARRPRTLPAWPHARTAAWAAGGLLGAAAVSPPLDLLATTDPRAHMTQHLLLGMYAPLGLVLGTPVTLLLGSASPAGRRRASRVLRSRPVHVLSRPAVAAVLDVGAPFVLHLTTPGGAVLADPVGRRLVLVHFLAAGCLFTWSVAGSDPAPRRPGIVGRVVVLVGAAGAHAFLAKLLYARAVEASAHSAVAHHADERAAEAARWMYYGGDGAELLLAVVLFATWYRRRRARRAW